MPRSTNCIAATDVIALVIEAIWKIVSSVIGASVEASRRPATALDVMPSRLPMNAEAPAIAPLSIASFNACWMVMPRAPLGFTQQPA